MKQSWFCAGSVLALTVGLVTAAEAQSTIGASATQAANSSGIQEVIVTSQKRAENVQDVPISIVAVSGAQLEKAGVTNVTQLEQIVPSFQFYNLAQTTGVTLLIRGFGTSSNAAIDPDVAPYIDGIYIPRPGALLTSFLDISSVEVLRGPQGTLSGRNATVGALEFNTNQPSFRGPSTDASLDVSSYATVRGTVVQNLPVTDTFALRAAVEATSTNGYVDNRFDGGTYGRQQVVEGRLSAKWAITPNLTWLGRADYARTTGDGLDPSALDAATAPPAQLAAMLSNLQRNGGAVELGKDSYNADQRFDDIGVSDQQTGISSDLTWDGPGGYKLRLIDSYRDWHNAQTDGDNSETTLDIDDRHARFGSTSQTHELQLISPQDKLLGGKLNFVAGFYYFEESYKIKTSIDLESQYCGVLVAAAGQAACRSGPQANANYSLFTQKEDSYAGYIQGDYKLTPTLVLTLGGRLTSDDKTGTFLSQVNNPGAGLLGAAEAEDNLKSSKTQPTWRANLSWHLTPDVMTYVSYSTGYKSGGFNSASAAAPLTTATRTFTDETAENYEIGIKSVFFNHRLLLNADAYLMNIDDFQQRSFNGTIFIVRNAGDIRSEGVELDAQYRITDHLKAELGGDYLYSYFTSNPNAPGLPGCSAAVANSCVGDEIIVGGNPGVQNLTGRPNNTSPRWQGDLALEYDSDPFFGGWTMEARPDISFMDRFYSTPDDNPQGIVKSRTLLGARINFISPDHNWTFTLYGTNLTDQHYWTIKYAQPLAGAFGGNNAVTGQSLLRGFLGQPMFVGGKLAVHF